MKIKTVCVLGGTGFVGRHLVARLTNEDYKVRTLTRHRERHRDGLVVPDLELREVASFSADTLASQFKGCDAVINLVGILNGTEAAFQSIHVELAQVVVEACRTSGVRRYLHMSALNADAENGPSAYLRSKGAAEDVAHQAAEHGILVTSFRPSVIFGLGDGFFGRFATLLQLGPVLPLACPNTRFAPVYIDDVVSAFFRSLADEDTAGQRLELCGPKVYTLQELVKYTAQLIGRRRIVWGLSDGMSRLQAKCIEWPFKFLPFDPPLSTDNYLSLQVDSVCRSDGLAALGITPHAVESVMPRVFGGTVGRTRYNSLRRVSRR